MSYFMSDLLARLIFWIFFAIFIAAHLGLFYRRHACEGTLVSPEDVFDSEPGKFYFRLRERHGNQTVTIEHFTVSVFAPSQLFFELTTKVPPAITASALDIRSTKLFDAIFKGFIRFSECTSRLVPRRTWQTKLMVAMSMIPHSASGQLLARRGRLVLSW